MATFPRITRSSNYFVRRTSRDENKYFIRPPRTPYPDACSEESTLAYSTSSSPRSPNWRGVSVPSTESESTSSQSLPLLPLDNIPTRLHARFPRFSTTTELSQPDLSIEDVTSTRISVDEHGIVAVPYNDELSYVKTKLPGRFHRTIRKAISHQTMFLRKARVGVRRMPSHWGLVGKSRDQHDRPSSLTSSEVIQLPRASVYSY